MNYQRIYNEIVERAKTRVLDISVYREKHHIIPRCLNGSDDVENLVELTAREHFLCHWLLVRIHPDNSKLGFAFWSMCSQKSTKQLRYTPSSRAYQEAKELGIQEIKRTQTGRKHSEEHKEKNRQASLKKRHSEEVKKKMSLQRKGRIVSEETKLKLSLNRKGKPSYIRTEENKKKMSESCKIARQRQKDEGYKISDEHRKKMSEVQKRRRNSIK